jgi:hypothetical protein
MATESGEHAVQQKIQQLNEREGTQLSVLVGDCPTGIDESVRRNCSLLGVDYATFNANWGYSKKRAGPRRNNFLIHIATNLEASEGHVLVYYYAPRGVPCHGTADCVHKAKGVGLRCVHLGDGIKL